MCGRQYARVAAASGIIAMALAGCASGPAMRPQVAAVKPADCSALLGVASEMATITSATPVAAAETIGTTKVTVPFCRVQGVARPATDSLINFEVWLPATASAWSGRLKTDGTGGYAGATPVARMAADLAAGFVVAGSDMGHAGGESADWTMGHPEKVKDWGYRAHYFVTTAAKALTNAFYGKPAAALARWVEQGVAPEAIVATTLKDGAVLRQRSVCVYPKQARYSGSGDINVAANFTCVTPGVEQPGASAADLNQIRNSLRQRALLGPVR